MEDNISKIKERLDIVDVISGYIKVQKAGVNYKARCPFHNEKTPSFYISPERQIWHCFGCNLGGDVFGFVKEIEGIEFGESLRILAQKAGVELQKYDSGVRDEKSRLYDIAEASSKFFEKQLQLSNIGQRALKYLFDRGLNQETISDFRVGFAPNDWNALNTYLKSCGYHETEISAAGLAIPRQTGGGIYDRFRSRITFPVMDAQGRIVGFSGRVFEGEETEAKYINTPQTLIYDKSMVIYGLHKAKTEIRQSNVCILVEGNIDALMSHQGGVRNAVATSGTALTDRHLKIIQRYTANLNFCFDTDRAGSMATRRGIALALANNMDVKVVALDDPACKDPADYVLKHGQGWKQKVSEAKPAIQFYFDNLKSHINPSSVEGKKTAIAALAPFINRLVSKVEREHWIGQLAIFLKTKEEALKADIQSAKDDLAVFDSQYVKPISQKITKPEDLIQDIFSEAILSLIIAKPDLFGTGLNQIQPETLSPYTASVISHLNDIDFQNFSFSDFIKKFSGPEAMKLEFAYLRAQELWNGFSDAELKSEFDLLLKKLKRRSLLVQLSQLEMDIKEAELTQNREYLKSLIQTFSRLTSELNAVEV
ncbi:MAG: primase protein [Candidatus Yanofskybacteria bacterium GW2011_GWA1_44_21]|uniref:DNA primase n=2 Tax=Candidatus Yanofskyibacteriota TaxID=1752733 RepID=A0A1F8GZ47_9BACT|nr:MAG: primase protein [Candidatus Yanofskybacteria bacterium GW2011_GWA2_44_10]KKT50610.1 MAG: primase protein [Candidatus Yanofskybacteria bacterium GW2011_GWA1_44_21]KKT90124.1 MAG: primase protein [Candidatus Yanofskybacteria bacterium GW2011_GWB1_45_11]OGN02789.1 MAG: DNA primase [Candidatus Yanofskybacteria bacterium RIFCSPHIGHO2_01_FULL_44_110b]OGN14662.1 MAG: DNA primase [Candidatus Yanofskybacteria bacterium RIFCSPHIGHO2_02_FULL_44_36b]OGN18732.1 MAG: DNA primase [Candidatus Yanofsky